MKKRELLKHLPGFRSNNKYKKVISIVGHLILLLVTLLMILFITQGGITKQDKCISLMVNIVMYLFFIVIPYIIVANPFYLKKYIPIFNMRNKIIGNILGVCLLVPTIVILCGCAINTLESNYSDEYKVIQEERRLEALAKQEEEKLKKEQKKLERLAKKEQERLEKIAKQEEEKQKKEQERLEKIAKQEEEKQKKEQERLEKIAKQEAEKKQKDKTEEVVAANDKEKDGIEVVKSGKELVDQQANHQEQVSQIKDEPNDSNKSATVEKSKSTLLQGELINSYQDGIHVTWNPWIDVEDAKGEYDLNGDGIKERIVVGRDHPNGTRIEVISKQGQISGIDKISFPEKAFNEYGDINEEYIVELFISDINHDKKVEILVGIGNEMWDLGVSILSFKQQGGAFIFNEIGYIEGQHKIIIHANNTIDNPYGSQGLYDTYTIEEIIERYEKTMNERNVNGPNSTETERQVKDELELFTTLLWELSSGKSESLAQCIFKIQRYSTDYMINGDNEGLKITKQYIQKAKNIMQPIYTYHFPKGYGLQENWEDVVYSIKSLESSLDTLLVYMDDKNTAKFLDQVGTIGERYSDVNYNAQVLNGAISVLKQNR